MCTDQVIDVEEDFAFLTTFLPEGWQEKAKELGALRRCRKVANAEMLLRVLLIHLAEGCSLRETAVRARAGQIAELSDVAIMDRLRCSGEWFRWINGMLMNAWVGKQPASVFGDQWRVRLVDGTRIKEPGPTGSSWCVHYCIGLPSLMCDELIIADNHGDGETFKQYAVHPGDLFIGDRVYGTRQGIEHVVDGGGSVVVRFAMSNLPLSTPCGKSFKLLPHLRKLRATQLGDWPALIETTKGVITGRICALKKSRQAAEKARRQVVRQAQKGGHKPKPETLEAAAYIFVFTTVSDAQLSCASALEMYRGRWQIELVFKRLKSILGLGHLHKIDPSAARAWIEGKLLVAFLVEALIRAGESFFPWGYPLCTIQNPQSQPLA